ncbi:MAG: hypothetical protein GY937_23055 [bacterium]|nr:hypothetical protein [bacterium]
MRAATPLDDALAREVAQGKEIAALKRDLAARDRRIGVLERAMASREQTITVLRDDLEKARAQVHNERARRLSEAKRYGVEA